MLSLWNKAKKGAVSDLALCQGVVLEQSFFEIKENRLRTLLMKGIIVYLLTMGSIGCYLSAMGCSCSALALNLVLLPTAIGCAFLYYNRVVENVGYILLFILFLFAALLFKNYINSGFYAVVNDTLEQAAIYLDMDGLQHYNEKISNRYLAITISMCFIGIVSNILLNVYISRRMQYVVAILVVLPVNLIPLYFEHEPDTVYAVMLLAGIAMTYCMKAGQHYKVQSSDRAFVQDKKKNIKYAYNEKSIRQSLLVIFLYIFVAVEVLNLLFPKKSYDASHADNKYKTATMETAANVFALGLAGLMNFYTNDGGLNSGKLGGVSSIRLDYNTDLTVQFTPYSYDTVYLKDFTGDTYLPYTNQWTVSRTMIEELKSESREAAALEQAYQQGADYTAKGYMNITNVDAVSSVYLPYYSGNNHTVVQYGLTETYTYYPRLTGNETTLEEYQVPEEYLTVPEENLETIEAFCQEAGFGGTQEEIISQVIQYYQDQIPYTIRPGATPKNQDFINYFLSKNKKGYCAHFASAATLIFRYYGIPARYAEGYAISYNDVMNGELLDASYSDYYDGYSEIGATGLVEVDVTDADAHAWVEVYDPNYGWVVVDVTPSGAQEDETEDFWSAFQKLFDQEDEDTAADENGSSGLQIRLGDNFMQRIAFVVLVILCGIVVFFAGKPVVRFLQFQAAYRQAGRNDRLVMEYNRYFQKKKKKDQALSKQMNYRSQIAYLVEHGYMELGEAEEKHMVDIMQQAGFSNREISASDFDFAAEQLRRKKN